jgi:hypothetical protein
VITSLAGALTPPSSSVTVNGIVTVPLKLAAGVKMNDAACRGGDRCARHDRRRAVDEIEDAFACRWQAGDGHRRDGAVDVRAAERDRDVGVFVAAGGRRRRRRQVVDVDNRDDLVGRRWCRRRRR